MHQHIAQRQAPLAAQHQPDFVRASAAGAARSSSCASDENMRDELRTSALNGATAFA